MARLITGTLLWLAIVAIAVLSQGRSVHQAPVELDTPYEELGICDD